MFATIAAIFIAYSTFVLMAASLHGRPFLRAHRISCFVGLLGMLLVLPVALMGTFGFPVSWTTNGLLQASLIAGYVGIALIAASSLAWIALDSAFVWRQRRSLLGAHLHS